MRKKLRWLAAALFAGAVSMMAVPVAGHAKEQCARIDYVENEDWGRVYYLKDAGAHPGELKELTEEEYYKLPDEKCRLYSTDWKEGTRPLAGKKYRTEATERGTHFQVTASHGAVVTFGTKENKMAETQADWQDANGEDVYRFVIPAKIVKNGGKKFVTARLGTIETKLTVEYKKAVITPSNSSIIIKGSLDTSDKACTYGKIKIRFGNQEQSQYRLYTKEGTSLDVNEDTTAADWNKFMKPLIREGATVFCEHDANSWYYGFSCWYDGWFKSEAVYDTTDTSWVISTEKTKINRKGRNPIKQTAHQDTQLVKVDSLLFLNARASDTIKYRLERMQ